MNTNKTKLDSDHSTQKHLQCPACNAVIGMEKERKKIKGKREEKKT